MSNLTSNETTGSAPSYATGADFFHDTVTDHGRDEAHIICGNYLSMQMKSDLLPSETRFCRELFSALYEDSIKHVDCTKLIYPYDFEKSDERAEKTLYHSSRKQNIECAESMHKAINDSCYNPNFYNLDIAVMKIVHDYGFERTNHVLAKVISNADYDGRYSSVNKEWSKKYDTTSPAFDNVYMDTHPVLINSVTNYARKLYEELGAERYALPGVVESGQLVSGYELVRSIQFDNNLGFAVGLNPHAPNQFVCWQSITDGSERDFYWGNYYNSIADAVFNYTARIMAHIYGNDLKEVRQADNFYKSTEQKRNTADDIKSTQPSVLDESKAGTASVLEQIKDARSAPKQQKPNQEHGLDNKTKKKPHHDL